MIPLLLLPFMFAKKFIWMFIWHFIYFFLCRPKLLIVALAALIAGGLWYVKNVDNSPRLAPVAAEVVLPTFKHTPQKANGRFATDLVSTLDDDGLAYYGQQYQYAMFNTKDGRPYLWVAHDMLFGKITPYKMFTTKRGNRCRKFTEMLHTPNAAHLRDGIGCERKKGGGWCRLPAKATPNCEIGFRPNGVIDKIKGLF